MIVTSRPAPDAAATRSKSATGILIRYRRQRAYYDDKELYASHSLSGISGGAGAGRG